MRLLGKNPTFQLKLSTSESTPPETPHGQPVVFNCRYLTVSEYADVTQKLSSDNYAEVLDAIRPLVHTVTHGNNVLDAWHSLITVGELEELVSEYIKHNRLTPAMLRPISPPVTSVVGG